MCINWQFTHDLYNNKNALTVAFSLTCLEIRSQNEEAINSTQNRIYSLKVFYFRLYRLQYFLFFLNWFSVSDDRKYLCGLQAWLFACINTRKFKGLDSIIARDQKSDFNSTSFQSSLKTSPETQGQIVGARESLNGRKNMARRKVKNGEKSPCGQCLTRPVPKGLRRSDFWLGREHKSFLAPIRSQNGGDRLELVW